MARYIERDNLEKWLLDEISELEECVGQSCGDELYDIAVSSRQTALEQVLALARRTPTADVVEVRHGEWVHSNAEIRGKRYHKWTCSLCGRVVARVREEDIEDAPYCHCGAKMDGGADG